MSIVKLVPDSVGAGVGAVVGACDGAALGRKVGAVDGRLVGEADGPGVARVMLGTTVGLPVGLLVASTTVKSKLLK